MIPFRQQIGIEKYREQDAWGSPTYEDIRYVRARVTERAEWVVDAYGKEVLQQARILLPGKTSIQMDDRIHYGGHTERTPLQINLKRDLSGRVLLIEVVV